MGGQTPKVQSNELTTLLTHKGYNIINVQIILDQLKRILWLSDKFTGSTHNSPTFQEIKLYDLLVENYKELYDKFEYLLANSFYQIFPASAPC